MTFEGKEREAAMNLILMILRRYHPRPVRKCDLKAEFVALVSEHGSASAALAAVMRKDRQ
jgi:hypothetical protein